MSEINKYGKAYSGYGIKPKDIELYKERWDKIHIELEKPVLSTKGDQKMILPPNCYNRKCIHYLGVKNDGDELTERVYCKAYQDKIPMDIAYGRDKHLKVRPDQSSAIVFEKILD